MMVRGVCVSKQRLSCVVLIGRNDGSVMGGRTGLRKAKRSATPTIPLRRAAASCVCCFAARHVLFSSLPVPLQQNLVLVT